MPLRCILGAMTRALPLLLTHRHLSVAERSACRLDGIGVLDEDCVRPLDTDDSALARAATVFAVTGDSYIAMRLTAAWIHGGVTRPPPVLELCTDRRRRTQRALARPATLRQLVLRPGDTMTIGTMTVTSPLRTVIDLLASAPPSDARPPADDPLPIAAAVAVLTGVTVVDVRDRLDQVRSAPGRLASLAALDRLASFAGFDRLDALRLAQPALTRYTS